MTDIFARLKAPFPKEDVSWRAQSMTQDKTKAMALAYIDARDVMQRLDEVVGEENWQDRYPHAGGKTVCEIGININGEWIWKADGAGDSDIEAEKGALSDAFKRAAVRWGVGRYLYYLKSPWVPCSALPNGKFKEFTDDPWKYVRGPGMPALERPKDDPVTIWRELQAALKACQTPEAAIALLTSSTDRIALVEKARSGSTKQLEAMAASLFPTINQTKGEK